MVMLMVMNDLLPPPLCNVNRPSHSEIQLFQNLTMKIHGQGHVWGQRSRSSLTFKIQRSQLWSSSNPLVTFEAWSSIDMFAFSFVAIGPLLAEISEIPYLTLKIQGQGHRQGQTRWSHLRPRVQSLCLLFVSWQSDHLWLRHSKFYIWPWKFKVKVIAKVKPNGHIWALEFNRYVCFSFRGNRTIFGWEQIPYLTLKNLGQGHDENRPKSNQVVYRSGPTIVQKMKEIQKVVQKLSREQESAAGGGGGGVRTGTKT